MFALKFSEIIGFAFVGSSSLINLSGLVYLGEREGGSCAMILSHISTSIL